MFCPKHVTPGYLGFKSTAARVVSSAAASRAPAEGQGGGRLWVEGEVHLIYKAVWMREERRRVKVWMS